MGAPGRGRRIRKILPHFWKYLIQNSCISPPETARTVSTRPAGQSGGYFFVFLLLDVRTMNHAPTPTVTVATTCTLTCKRLLLLRMLDMFLTDAMLSFTSTKRSMNRKSVVLPVVSYLGQVFINKWRAMTVVFVSMRNANITCDGRQEFCIQMRLEHNAIHLPSHYYFSTISRLWPRCDLNPKLPACWYCTRV